RLHVAGRAEGIGAEVGGNKTEQVELVALGGREIGDGDAAPVAAAEEPEGIRAVAAAGADAGARVGAEDQEVVAGVSVHADRMRVAEPAPAAGVEDVVAIAALQGVVTVAAPQGIVAGAAIEQAGAGRVAIQLI